MVMVMVMIMIMTVMMMLPSECQTNRPDGEEQSLKDVSCHKGFTYAHFHNKPLLSVVASELKYQKGFLMFAVCFCNAF